MMTDTFAAALQRASIRMNGDAPFSEVAKELMASVADADATTIAVQNIIRAAFRELRKCHNEKAVIVAAITRLAATVAAE